MFPGTGLRTKKGPSKLTQGPFLCYSIWKTVFYATYRLSKFKLKWSIKQFYPCGLYQYQLTIVGTHLQPKIVWSPLIATWWVYRLLHQAVTSRFAALRQRYNCSFVKYCCSALGLKTYGSQMDFKGPHNNGKDLLRIRKDPWAESKDLRGLLLTNQFPRT